MKRILTILAVLVLSLPTYAQLLWPVKGADAGSNIISRPQHYVDGELNFAELFIAADEGTEILSPSDGTIVSLGINYLHSLIRATSYSVEGTFDDAILEVKAKADLSKINPKYMSGQVGIRLSDGRKIYISGLRGNVHFKTGMKINKGDLLGTASYAYKAFDEPHICLSVSTAKGTPDDPMTPFGLETSFVAPGEIITPEILTPEQAQEDFNILMDAYVELFPSFYDIVTPEQFEEFKKTSLAKLQSDISYKDFWNVIWSSTSTELAHDSHLSLLTPNPWEPVDGDEYKGNLLLGAIGDSLFVTQALEGAEHLLGKKVDSLDNESASDVIRRIEGMTTGYDAGVRSKIDRLNLVAWNRIYHNRLTEPRTTRVRFSDGTEYVDIWQKSGRGGKYIPALSYEVDYYKRMLQSYSRNWDFKELNDSTVLLTVNTFTLNDVEVDDIVSKIGENVQKENMIIDLRLNPGGHVSAMNRFLSVFIDTTSVALNQYAMVNSNVSYESFKYSLNYDQSIAPFEEFKQIEGKKGFYADSEYPVNDIAPDSLVHYPGKVYILTSDQSCSAATVFTSVLVRNHRAVTVGRETGTAYHYVTAMKFADIQLPNSKIQVHIPLVKEVFDDVVNDRVPYGRGLLPDYEVPVTYEEFFTAENDIILEKALELIAEGKYIGENPFEVKENMSECAAKGKSLYMYLLLGILAVGGTVWVSRKKK